MQTIQERKLVRYSISFRQMVVQEVETGSSIESIRRKYDIGGSGTIQKWLKKFGKHHLLNKIVRVENSEDRNKQKQLEQEVKRLKVALADAHMEKRCLEEVIKMANKEFKVDIKKNFGGQLAKNSKENTR